MEVVPKEIFFSQEFHGQRTLTIKLIASRLSNSRTDHSFCCCCIITSPQAYNPTAVRGAFCTTSSEFLNRLLFST